MCALTQEHLAAQNGFAELLFLINNFLAGELLCFFLKRNNVHRGRKIKAYMPFSEDVAWMDASQLDKHFTCDVGEIHIPLRYQCLVIFYKSHFIIFIILITNRGASAEAKWKLISRWLMGEETGYITEFHSTFKVFLFRSQFPLQNKTEIFFYPLE